MFDFEIITAPVHFLRTELAALIAALAASLTTATTALSHAGATAPPSTTPPEKERVH